MITGLAYMTSPPPNFCDVILSKLCFNCSHWFYAMPTNRQLDNSFPVVLDIFGKGLNLPAPLDIQWPKCFQLQGGEGALPPDPRYRLMLRTLHSAPQPSLVIALLYSLCIHKIGLRISVHNFLSDLVTACNKSRQKTRVTNLFSKALQDNTHEMIDKN